VSECRIIAHKAMKASELFVAGILWAMAANGQEPAAQPLMAEQVFKNVKVLKGIPVGEFMDTMGFFAASLGLNCVYCHVSESLENWDKFAEDVPRKNVARSMILMVNAINKNNFGGRRAITCYSCHRGAERPKLIPSLAEQYSVPEEDPNEVEIVKDAPAGPSAEEILNKYIQAVGGTDRLSALTSFVGRGTYEGYDSYHEKVPMDIYARAPGQLSIVIHTQNGDTTTTFDGRSGWIAAVDKPVHLLPLLAGSELDGARFDADLCFPSKIREALGEWRNGFPPATIGDREVRVIQGIASGGSRIKLYFDSQTGLLARQVRYTNTVVGTIPLQIDYSDYRNVSGVKMPFHWVVTWTDGQSTYELSAVQANAPIDAARLAKPAEAVLKKAVR
jgi:photosynthetic reaction center cytochrome c subunit